MQVQLDGMGVLIMLWPNGTKTRPTISSPYGWRVHPVTGVRKLHAGADLIGYALVRAIAPGTVVAVGTPRGWEGGGIQVWVQHSGVLSRSMHLKSTPSVRVGESIEEGRILGIAGKTGTATGIHHHLEVVVDGAQIDPVPFITARLATTAGGTAKPLPTPTPQEDDTDMRIFRTTPDGSFYLAKPGGFMGIRNPSELVLLRRLLESRPGHEPEFNAAERDIIRYYMLG